MATPTWPTGATRIGLLITVVLYTWCTRLYCYGKYDWICHKCYKQPLIINNDKVQQDNFSVFIWMVYQEVAVSISAVIPFKHYQLVGSNTFTNLTKY